MTKLKKFYKLIIGLIVIFVSSIIYSCGTKSSDIVNTKIIGEQEWMTKNLDVDSFRNGDAIPELKTNEEWNKAANEGLPGWCYYENDPNKGKKSGKLYNWYAVNDSRGLAPEGWHIPSREEWNEIQMNLEGNISLFSENLGGFRHLSGNFRMYGQVGYWGSSTETDAKVTSWIRQFSGNVLEETNAGKGTGFSILCIRGNKKI
jgi:hypothetical protein